MKRMRRDQRGFTLVEVLTVLAIIGVLAAIAVPSFRGFLPRVRLANATRTLSNQIAMLRMSAISKSADAEVTFNTTTQSYSLAKTVSGAPYIATNLTGSATLESLAWLDGTAATSPFHLVLEASGTVRKREDLTANLQRQAFVVTLRTPDGSMKKRVLIWVTGRVESQKWAGGTTWVED